MSTFSVSANPAQLADIQDRLAFIKAGYPRAMMRAANYAAARTKTATAQQLKRLITADPERIDNSLSTARATLGKPTAIFHIIGRAIPLFRFDVAFMYPTVTGGVTATIFKTGGAPLVLKHAFVARMKSGHTGVYQRTGKNRTPIQEHFGPHAARLFEKTPGVEKMLMDNGAEKFLSELGRQADYLIAKELGRDPEDG